MATAPVLAALGLVSMTLGAPTLTTPVVVPLGHRPHSALERRRLWALREQASQKTVQEECVTPPCSAPRPDDAPAQQRQGTGGKTFICCAHSLFYVHEQQEQARLSTITSRATLAS